MQAQSTHNAGFYFAYWPSFFSISLPPFEYIQITLVSALWCKTIFIICLICVQTEFTKRTLQLRHTQKKYTHGKRERETVYYWLQLETMLLSNIIQAHKIHQMNE